LQQWLGAFASKKSQSLPSEFDMMLTPYWLPISPNFLKYWKFS